MVIINIYGEINKTVISDKLGLTLSNLPDDWQEELIDVIYEETLLREFDVKKYKSDWIKEYDLNPSTFDRWMREYTDSGSFKAKDNRSPEEAELIKLRPENQQLKIENNICTSRYKSIYALPC